MSSDQEWLRRGRRSPCGLWKTSFGHDWPRRWRRGMWTTWNIASGHEWPRRRRRSPRALPTMSSGHYSHRRRPCSPRGLRRTSFCTSLTSERTSQSTWTIQNIVWSHRWSRRRCRSPNIFICIFRTTNRLRIDWAHKIPNLIKKKKLSG